MCDHGDRPLKLLESSKLTKLLDTVDAGDIDVLRHEQLGTTLSQIAIETKAVTEVKMLGKVMKDIAR